MSNPDSEVRLHLIPYFSLFRLILNKRYNLVISIIILNFASGLYYTIFIYGILKIIFDIKKIYRILFVPLCMNINIVHIVFIINNDAKYYCSYVYMYEHHVLYLIF